MPKLICKFCAKVVILQSKNSDCDMKKICIINGPNLNLVGEREPSVYGTQPMNEYIKALTARLKDEAEVVYFQSNIEGALIDCIQEAGRTCDGLVVNAGAYSHTSIALRDALLAVPAPAVEVHISNIFAREEFRHHSYLTAACRGMVCGLGMKGYEVAVRWLIGE